MCTEVYGGGALGAVCAMCCEISGAQGVVGCWLAGHIAQSRYWGQCRTDKYGCVRMCTEEGHMVQCVPCAVKFQKHMAVWSVGWRGTLRRADTVSAGIRTNTDEYGLLRTMVTWCSVCHVLLYFCSARLTESQSPTPYSSVLIRTSPYYSACPP